MLCAFWICYTALLGLAAASPLFGRRSGSSPSERAVGFVKRTARLASTYTSKNWAGAVVSGENISQVQATYRIPHVSLPQGADPNQYYYGSAWIGIGGSGNCGQGLWQAGTYWTYVPNSGFVTTLFYEWLPGSVEVPNLIVKPGDTITVVLRATSSTSGSYTIINRTTGEKVSQSLSRQPEICLNSAEWIVEDNDLDVHPFPDYGTITFDAATYIMNGQTNYPSGSTIDAMNSNGDQWAECSTAAQTVKCTWADADDGDGY